MVACSSSKTKPGDHLRARRLEQSVALEALARDVAMAELDADGPGQLAQCRHDRLVLDLDARLPSRG